MTHTLNQPHEDEVRADDVRAEDGADTAAETSPETSPEADAPEADEPQGPTFIDLGLDARVLTAIEKLGYTAPSPIQEQTIPLILDGRDVVGLAQTGTGKTGAFALPVLSRLAESADVNGRADAPQVLVLAPTRELALQVADAFDTYAKQIDDVSVLAVYGGSPYGPQLAGLRRGAQVVVGTPGRVIDHLERGSLDLSQLQTLVLDEADEMLRMGFAEEVDRILASTPETKQTALFSATMPPAIRRISAQYLNDPQEVAVARQSTTSSTIRQRYLTVGHQWKLEAFTRIMETEEHDGVIAFVRTRAGTEDLTRRLNERGFKAVAISGDIAQKQREKTVEDLKAGRVDILVATDVAARGLDVERISLVVNYDVPHDSESYVHRIGRTGRAGRSGDAVLFITPRERYLLRSIEKTTRKPVEEMQLPSLNQVNEARKARFADRITATLETASAEDLEVFRAMVVDYVEKNEAEPDRVAAAIAMMVQDGRPLLAEEPDLPPSGGKGRRDRDRGDRPERGERDGRGSRGPRREPAAGNATYWVAVGHNDRVKPGHLVGALANEVGLPGNAIGAIDLRGNHSLIELPKDLTPEQLEAGARAEVNGRPLGLRLDTGRPTRAERGEGNDDGPRRRHDGPRGRQDRFDRDERGGHDSRDDRRRGFGRRDRFERDDRGDRGGRFDRNDRDDRHGSGDRYERDGEHRRPGVRGNRDDNHIGKKPRWSAGKRRERGAGEDRGGRGRGGGSWGRDDDRRGGDDRGKRGGGRGRFGSDKGGRGGIGGGKGGRGSGPKRFGHRPQR